MGDIFRRNAFNLGLHVVQSPEAVADARTATSSRSIRRRAQIVNVTQGKTLRRRCRSAPKEDEIRQSGGIFAVGRREFRAVGRAHAARSSWPDAATRATHDDDRADRLGASRRQGRRRSRPGATLRVYADLLPASDGTAPFSIHTFNQITGGNTIYPRQAAVANDHFVFTGKDDDDKQTAIGRAVRGAARHREAVLRDARRRHLPLLFSRAGPGAAGAVHSRRRLAQPRLRRLRRGRHGRRLDDARLRLVDRLHLLHDGEAAPRRLHAASCSPWVTGKDIVLELLRRWGAKQSQGMSVEFVDATSSCRSRIRNTIANMMAEAEALNGIFAPDEITYAWYRAKGIDRAAVSALRAAARTRASRSTRSSPLGDVAPMIAKPFSPGNAFPAEDVARERIDVRQGDDRLVHQRQLRRPAVGGAGAASRRATQGLDEGPRSELVVFPGSGGVKRQIEQPDPRLGGESIADVFRGVGGEIRAVVVRPVLRPGPGRARQGPARDHVVQPQLAEPHGPRRRGLPRQPRGRRRVRAARLHGAAAASSGSSGTPRSSASDLERGPAGEGPQDLALSADRAVPHRAPARLRRPRALLRAVRQPRRASRRCSCTAAPAAATTPQHRRFFDPGALPHRAVRPARLRQEHAARRAARTTPPGTSSPTSSACASTWASSAGRSSAAPGAARSRSPTPRRTPSA